MKLKIILPIVTLLFLLVVYPAFANQNHKDSEDVQCENTGWNNHGQFVSCNAYLHLGGRILSIFARSDVGKHHFENFCDDDFDDVDDRDEDDNDDEGSLNFNEYCPSPSPSVSPSPSPSPTPEVSSSPSPSVSPSPSASPTAGLILPGSDINFDNGAFARLLKQLQELINRLQHLFV